MLEKLPDFVVVRSTAIATIMRPSGISGPQTHTERLAQGFRSRGIDCHVVSPFLQGRRWLPVFAVRPLLIHHLSKNWSTRWYRHWHRVALAGSLRRLLAVQPVDAVVAQDPLSAAAALQARRMLGRAVPVVLVSHFNTSQADEFREKGELSDDRAYRTILDFETEVFRAVDAVVYASKWSQNVIEQERGIRPRRSLVIHPGAPDVAHEPSVLERHDLGFGDEDVIFVNVGTVEPRKNQLGLLDAFARLAAQDERARLLLVGDGPDLRSVQARMRALRLDGSVRCVGARSDVGSLLGLADCYVHYARLENYPAALLEAASARLPVAAVPVGGVNEILTEIDDAIVLADDPEAAAARLLPLVRSAAVRARYGAASRRAFERSFSLDVTTQRFVELLESL